MRTYNISEARQRFAAIVKQAEAGEEIELQRHGRSVVRVVPVKRDPLAALAKFREARKKYTLGKLSIRELLKESRRY